jgi:hypothetical protein
MMTGRRLAPTEEGGDVEGLALLTSVQRFLSVISSLLARNFLFSIRLRKEMMLTFSFA